MIRTPAFTATAIATLAIGIALSTAAFTIAEAVLIRPLPVRDQTSLVALWGKLPDGGFANYPLSLASYREFGARTLTLSGVAGFGYEGASTAPFGAGDRVLRLRRSMVTGNLFDVLGVRAQVGRALAPGDDEPGSAPAAVLSHSAWQRYFGGDSAVVGAGILMHDLGRMFTVVGVMPRGLDFPGGTDVWAPVVASTPPRTAEFIALNLVGRLMPGAPLASARSELTAYFGRDEAPVWQRNLEGVAIPLPGLILGDTRPALVALSVAAALLLLVSSINVATLLVVRGTSRIPELATRSALGAGRMTIIGQLLKENLLLAAVASAVGAALAAAAVRAFVLLAPEGFPRVDEIGLHAVVVVIVILVTAVAASVFGVVPAIAASRADILRVIRTAGRHSAGRRARIGVEGLVAAQIAMAVVITSAAGLIAKTFLRLERENLSFTSNRLHIGQLVPDVARYAGLERQRLMLDAVLERLRATPGISDVTPMVATPFSGSRGWDGRPAADGQTPEQAAANPMLNMEVVAPGYFATLGIPILRGRAFTATDVAGAPPVVLVSESTARHYWGTSDPIGKRLSMGSDRREALTVIGLVPDTRYRDLRDARPSIYFVLDQSFFPFVPLTLGILTVGSAQVSASILADAVREAAPGVELAGVAPFEEYRATTLAGPRLNAILLSVFAGCAMVLAAVGLFGVMATMVRQRTNELGLRMALGATAANVARLVAGRGLIIGSVGIVVGLVGALAVNGLVAGLLYRLEPGDAGNLAVVSLSLLVVTTIASGIPAWSTTRIDPAKVVREQ